MKNSKLNNEVKIGFGNHCNEHDSKKKELITGKNQARYIAMFTVADKHDIMLG